jgi:hypothetical protein
MLYQLGPVAADSAVNRDHPLNRGRIAWWLQAPGTANGGGRLVDLCGRYHGTLTNMTSASWKSTQQGEPGLNFVGASSQYVTFSSLTSLNFAGGSLAWWLYPTLAFNDGATHGWFGPSSGGDNPSFQKFSTGNLFCGWTGGRVTVAASAANYTQNTWQRYMFTWVSGGTHTLYRNGVSLGTATGGTVSAANVAMMMGRCVPSSGFFTGGIRDQSIWSRTLSAAEVLSDYNLSRQGYPGVLNRRSLLTRAVLGTPTFVPPWWQYASQLTIGAA